MSLAQPERYSRALRNFPSHKSLWENRAAFIKKKKREKSLLDVVVVWCGRERGEFRSITLNFPYSIHHRSGDEHGKKRVNKTTRRRRQLFLSFSLPLSPSSLMIELTQRQMTRLSSSSDMATGNLRLGFPWCQSLDLFGKGRNGHDVVTFHPPPSSPTPPYVLYSSKNKQ